VFGGANRRLVATVDRNVAMNIADAHLSLTATVDHRNCPGGRMKPTNLTTRGRHDFTLVQELFRQSGEADRTAVRGPEVYVDQRDEDFVRLRWLSS